MPPHNARPQARETEASFSRSVKLPRCCEFQCPGSTDECANGLRSACQEICVLEQNSCLLDKRIERRKMSWFDYQNCCLFVRGKRRKVWVARWREDVILADGSTSRVMRSAVLGLVSEIKGRREARRLLDARLNHFNKVQ